MRRRVERLEQVASTMDVAHERGRLGAEEGLWISTERQTQGRGRRGRSWLSSDGALATTLLLRPALRRPAATPAEIATLSFIIALALRDALRALGVGADIALKWPNDVLVAGGKIAGLLLEMGGGEPGHLAVGVGLNLKSAPDWSDLEDQAVRPTAVSEHSRLCTNDEALNALADAFEPRYQRWIENGFAGQREEWLSAASGLGGPLTARLGDQTLEGRFADVDAEGALILDTQTGRRRIFAADVFLPTAKGG